ncbi:hypothetical protein I4F81_000912 [Pyropia yezoensis]|uniref:Uncharacterized protein n=1 Tax=Pyropia yezoensis TaxID=2788 RepID=A0ACC3BL38_PYRYE|nr:hypothetical protein I4F81_000912 [Neopyropia yezoensis]
MPPLGDQPVAVFFSVAIPPLDTRRFVRRLMRHCQLSPTVVVVAFVLLERARAADQRLALSGWNMHRLLLAALTVSCKSVERRNDESGDFALVGGLESGAEMVRLERVFLGILNWRVQVNQQALDVAEDRLLERFDESGADGGGAPAGTEAPPAGAPGGGIPPAGAAAGGDGETPAHALPPAGDAQGDAPGGKWTSGAGAAGGATDGTRGGGEDTVNQK